MSELTGRKVLAIFTLGFGTIIAVNMTLAVNAVRTFPGLETSNSYVASQKFEAQRAAQQALGWQAAARVEGGALVLELTDAADTPVRDARIEAVLGRATHTGEDRIPTFAFDGAAWRADTPALAAGNWDLRLVATAPDGTIFRKRLKLRGVR